MILANTGWPAMMLDRFELSLFAIVVALLLEYPVVRWVTRRGVLASIGIVIAMNCVSAIFGVPVAAPYVGGGWLWLGPNELFPLGYLALSLVSGVCEALVVCLVLRVRPREGKGLMTAIFAINIVSFFGFLVFHRFGANLFDVYAPAFRGHP